MRVACWRREIASLEFDLPELSVSQQHRAKVRADVASQEETLDNCRETSDRVLNTCLAHLMERNVDA